MTDDNPDFHPAVNLLLARMASNPNEFASSEDYDEPGVDARWGPYIAKYQKYFTEAEAVAVAEALRGIRMDAFHKELMQELVDPRAEREARERQALYDRMMKQSAISKGWAGGPGGYSNQQAGVALGSIPHPPQAVGLGSYNTVQNAALSQSEAFNKLYNDMYEQKLNQMEAMLKNVETQIDSTQSKLKKSFWGK